jgi:hypothetical protein
MAFLERPDLWKCRRFFTFTSHFNNMQPGQGTEPVYKNLNIMVFRTLCLFKHDTIMVSNTIDALLLRYPYTGIYRIAMCSILPDYNTCLFDKKSNSFMHNERIKQWISKKLKKQVTAKP